MDVINQSKLASTFTENDTKKRKRLSGDERVKRK